jgi:hypothetical protein
VTDSDSKDILRRWNREIEAELRREAAHRDREGPWKAVAWTALWVLWIALLVLAVAHIKALR